MYHMLQFDPYGGRPPRLSIVCGWRWDHIHAGDGLDVLVCGVQVSGRAEYTAGGEYFGTFAGWYLTRDDDQGWCPLVPGMQARRSA